MGRLFSNNVEFISIILVMILSLPLHEFAHGYVANFLGDPTAKNRGRLTLNPFRHLNFFGTLSMFFFGFGWANPVPVNVFNFSKPKKYMALVAISGPISNLLLSVFGVFILRTFDWALIGIKDPTLFRFVICFLRNIVFLNICLFVFNLLPIPPLDGSRIFMYFLPDNLYYAIMRHEALGSIILMLLLYNGVLSKPLRYAVNFCLKIFYFGFITKF